MPTFEIICLANSYKNNGRCIAGLKTDGSGWLRPVSTDSSGTLHPNDYILDTGAEPQLFDILEIECSEHRPRCHQPENWIIVRKKWQFVGHSDFPMLKKVLKPELDRSMALREILGNSSDRIEYKLLQQNPAQCSLLYLKPQDINWVVQEYLSRKTYRSIFTFNNIQYNFSITDPKWKSQMDQAQLPAGSYSSDEVISELNLIDFDSPSVWESRLLQLDVSNNIVLS
ncbi:MAG: dual OB domain-containing protein [Thainema sp.]